MKVSELFEAAPPKESIWQAEMPFASTGSNDVPEKEAAKFAKRFKVHLKMTNPHGPSGGWPEFVFWGPRENMEKLLKAYNKGAGLSKEEELEGLSKSRLKYDTRLFTESNVEPVLKAIDVAMDVGGARMDALHEVDGDTVAFAIEYDFPEHLVRGSDMKKAGAPTVQKVTVTKGEQWRDGVYGAEFQITLATPLDSKQAAQLKRQVKEKYKPGR